MSDDYLSVEDQVDDPRRAKTEKRRNRWLLFSVLGVLVAVLLAGIGIATWYGKSAVDALDNINRDSNLMPTGERPAPVDPVDPVDPAQPVDPSTPTPASGQASGPASAGTASGDLARTGTDATGLLTAAIQLLAAGIVALVIRRRLVHRSRGATLVTH